MSNRTVLVTGSSRGIGKAIALKYAEEGYDVIINCKKNKEQLEVVRKDIEAFGVSCLSVLADVSQYQEVNRLFQSIENKFGKLDVLINNAAISHIGLLQDMTPEQWNEIIQTNLSSVFYCSRLAIPYMLSSKSGKIITISSVWGLAGASCEVAYSAAKGGIHAFTKALAKELAPSNIQVNAVACGAIDTEMNHFLSEEERETLKEEIPANRLGQPEEVAELVYSITQKNEYLTGQIISLDGGWI
ncbi:elongation factor P 5-aminopentanone reductase [Anaeromicropila populeti]|uniref:3-oxoacyl-[acyl-carrier protein] reductase n=1 Tax=Anaeromicropila populeti TaxID=37658 RepID=A0A1I6IE89_9FIRM|nr:3-oxoacyl-ACP reductase FabG [Anaeromicropila populeti]SFR65018.1 3-oxoacyl-[acyl-carrier protein] reductase [Anaeromicropila populeti]